MVTCEVVIIYITSMIVVIKPFGEQMTFLDMLSGIEMVITFLATR